MSKTHHPNNQTGSSSKRSGTSSAGRPADGKSSPTRQRILSFIQEYISRHNFSPTVREIAAGVGVSSPATIQRHMDILEQEGRLRRMKNSKRAIVLTGSSARSNTAGNAASQPASAPQIMPVDLDGAQLVDLMTYRQTTQLAPVVGEIAAGQGTIAEENIESQMVIPSDICGGGDLFVLRVRGDSMSDAAILDGDYVVARQQSTATDGDIVVAGINEDEATVKRFQFSGSPPGSTITLLPESQDHSPREFPASDVAVYGKVVSVLRRL